jgi:hypothetical protein
MFVADAPGNLSAGSLYAAKWNQMSPNGTDGGEANLSWIKLGHATHAEIKAAVDAGVTFNDLFLLPPPTVGFAEVKTDMKSPRSTSAVNRHPTTSIHRHRAAFAKPAAMPHS